MSTALTPALRDQHEQDEAIIAKGIVTFREVGEALQRIRDCRTYLQTHSTFEDYCRERWELSRIHAHRLIDAAETVKTLPMGNSIPNERVARAVAKIEPSVRVEVVEKAVAHAKAEGRDRITARDVETASKRPPPTAPVARPLPSRSADTAPSMGLMYADMAISQLEKIHKRDTKRAEAFALVLSYINENAPAPHHT